MGHSCNTQHILQRAEQRCIQSGVRFTEKRRRILSILVESHIPLSAYDVADLYHKIHSEKIPPMSVYRMLDFLVEETLAHKLSSANKYVACSHIGSQHHHTVSQFLICKQCNKAEEIDVPQSFMEQLMALSQNAGYRLVKDQFELECVCSNCDKKLNDRKSSYKK